MERHNMTIPRPLDSFIGRAAEIQAVRELLATHRLVMLPGVSRRARRISGVVKSRVYDG